MLTNILVTGASGLLGSALLPTLKARGHRVHTLRHCPGAADDPAVWNPAAGELSPRALETREVVIHLAGENVAGRWTPEKKRRIRESRVQGTRLLAERMAELAKPPALLIAASAVGIYGDRGEEQLTEESAPGKGFLAEVCQEWEAAAEPARQRNIRVVFLRFGVILAPRGGALGRMLPIFKMGLGGRIGSGRQFWPWLHREDAVGLMLHALQDDSWNGVYNAVAPHAVRNEEFTRALGRVLHRPTIFPLPAWAAKLFLGEMAEAALLSSARVEPQRALAGGYVFRHPQLEPALRHFLER